MAITSTTARVKRFGSDVGAREVRYLTADERDAVRAGVLVLFDCGRPADGHGGTTVRKIIYSGGRFYSRVPTPDQLELYHG